jgi:hypothetical protein
VNDKHMLTAPMTECFNRPVLYQLCFSLRVNGVPIRDHYGSCQQVTPWLASRDDCYLYAKDEANKWNADIETIGGAWKELL